MNAGQILMQMPVNATLPVAVPAAPEMSSSPAGDQQTGDFAGVLAGMTPQGSSRSAEGRGTAKPVGGGAIVANGMPLVPIQQDPDVDVAAALPVTLTKVAQAEPDDAGNGIDRAEPAAEKVAGDVVMPQNVVLCVSGALLAAERQINGRMPEKDLGIASRGGAHDRAMVVDLVDAMKPAPAPGNTSQSPAGAATENAEVASLPTEAAAAQKLSSVSGGQTPAVPEGSFQSGTVKIDDNAEAKSEVKSEVKAEIVRVAVQAIPEPVIDAAALSSESTSAGTQTPVTAPVEIVAANDMPEPRRAEVATAIPVQGTISGEQAAVAMETPGQAAVQETQTVAQGSAVRRQPPLKAEAADMAALSTPEDAGRYDSRAADSALLAAASDKGQATPRPAEFRFSRSVAVEAVLGNSRQANGTVSEKSAPVPEDGTRMAVAQQSAEGTEAGLSGSDAGSHKGDFEGFSQKTPDLARPAAQNMPGIHQRFSVETTGTTPPQALSEEVSRPGSSEQIAGQVRGQLGTHEIKSGNEQITIRLSPEHLGDIKVNFRLEDRQLKVEIVAENRFAKESLLQHADSLKESLARQNINMDKFEVTTGGGSSGNQGNHAQGEWRELAQNRQAQQWLASGGYRTQSAGELQKTPVYLAGTEHAVLDLHF